MYGQNIVHTYEIDVQLAFKNSHFWKLYSWFSKTSMYTPVVLHV